MTELNFLLSFKRCFNYSKKLILFSALTSAILSIVDVFAILILTITVTFLTNNQNSGRGVFSHYLDDLIHMIGIKKPGFDFVLLVAIVMILKSSCQLILQNKILLILQSKLRSNASWGLRQTIEDNSFDLNVFSKQEQSFALTDAILAYSIEQIISLIILITESILIVIYFCVMFLVNTRLTLILIVTIIPGIWISLRKIHKKSAYYGITNYANNIKSKYDVEVALDLSREIQLSGNQAYFIRRYLEHLMESAKASSKQIMLGNAPKYIMELLMILAFVSVSKILTTSSNIDMLVPYLAFFTLTTSRVFPAFLRLQSSLISFTQTSAKAKFFQSKYHDSYSLNPNEHNQKSAFEYPDGVLIEISDLQFMYSERNIGLICQSLILGPSGLYVVYGKSGVGKTTFINLVMGFLTPSHGNVKINKQDSKDWVRLNPGRIQYLAQDPILLADTIANNVTLGLEDSLIDYEKIRKILDSVGLTDCIRELPHGISTILSENGNNLSGGQRQRLALARALYMSPQLLILDEPSSALDAISEVDLIRILKELSKSMLILCVSHSKSMLDASYRNISISNNGHVNFL